MVQSRNVLPGMAAVVVIVAACHASGESKSAARQTTSSGVYGSVRDNAPGRVWRITPSDMPPPFVSESAVRPPHLRSRDGKVPVVPVGFRAELVTDALRHPRMLRRAPNGDVFVSETAHDRVSVVRDADGVASVSVFANYLDRPFGLAFQPGWLYVANRNSVVRFPYNDGDIKASGKPEVVVKSLTNDSGGHTTRDIVFDADGKHFYVSIGSGSNVAEGMGEGTPRENVLGALWGSEDRRADVIAYTADGQSSRIYATGLRNCVGLALAYGSLWCSTNERDGLGDDLVPDYVTRIRDGGFYGWPWYYIGDNKDPRWKGARADLAGKVTVPDVLVQPHSASLGMTFYDGDTFPAQYKGNAFSALHGSWNRSRRTGYKVVRYPIGADGTPTGSYEDFVTGFDHDEEHIWGRPVGVAVSKGGALLVTEDGDSTLWRIVYKAPR